MMLDYSAAKILAGCLKSWDMFRIISLLRLNIVKFSIPRLKRQHRNSLEEKESVDYRHTLTQACDSL